MLAEILEVMMVVSFGFAWPASILRSIRSKTSKGKSLSFLIIIDFGYICGVSSKLAMGKITYVIIFYILNLIMVTTDVVLYFINAKRDRIRDAEAAAALERAEAFETEVQDDAGVEGGTEP